MGSSAAFFTLFIALGFVGPGLALQRLARVSVDRALVLPLGAVCVATAYWLSLVTSLPWLFPTLMAFFHLPLLLMRGNTAPEEGPSLRGAIPAILATAGVLALTQYPFNRVAANGTFVLDGLVPFDTAFHVGLTRELTLGYPPQVPGIAGFPLHYHLGIDLVRGAALRWAHVDPYDAISRFDVTLWAVALILALRRAVRGIGGSPLAVHVAGFIPLLGDFSFVFATNPQAHWWTDLLRGNLLLSLAYANPLIPALAIALGTVIALGHYRDTGERGWLAIAIVLGSAVAFFKIFLGAHLALALVGATIVARDTEASSRFTRGWRMAGGVALFSTLLLAWQSGGQPVAVSLAPFDLVRITRETLSLPPVYGAAFVAWAALWLFASVGLRALGVAPAFRALRSPGAAAFAIIALTAWPLGVLFRVAPPDAVVGQKPINDAAFLIEQGGLFLWIFATLALSRFLEASRRPPMRVLAAAAAVCLSIPSTLHYVVKKGFQFPPDALPAPMVRAMTALASASQAGDVVMQRPGTRYPAAPVVLIGRRVPYERFTPYLTQFGSRADLEARHQAVYRFFHTTTDATEAAGIAQTLGTRYLCLYGNDRVRFDLGALYEPVYVEEGASVYRMR